MTGAPVDRLEMTRLFLRIAEAGSLSAAGRSLGISQPSVSRQLRQLETLLGVQLVRRTTHELTLTEAGSRFEEEGRALLASWERLGETLRADEGALAGPIRVLVPVGLGQGVLADIAASFLRAHPAITLQWLLDDAPRDLTAEGIDLWVRVGAVRDEGLIVRPLARLERVLVDHAGAASVEAPAGLEAHAAVMLTPFMGARLALDHADGRRVTVQPRVVASTDTLFAALRMVQGGVGWSALPRWLVAPEVAAGRLRLLCPDWRPQALALSLVWARNRFRPARVLAFAEALRAGVPEGLSAR
ncbi:MAG: LysR family transcriptional regulator [Pseudomonadota bacterium]